MRASTAGWLVLTAVLGSAAATLYLVHPDHSVPSAEPGVDPGWLAEVHHGGYGRPWCLGRDQVDFLVSRGLKPHHRVVLHKIGTK